MTTTTKIERKELLDGMIVVFELGPAPANIVDRPLMAELGEALTEAASEKDLKLVVIKGAGEHFSYGASVEEHTPDQVGEMLPEFHSFLKKINDLNLPPVVAAIDGRCFGGGFELALACDVIAVGANAQLGCPEIKLGVFPPAGAALLPLRLSAGRASTMLTTGAIVAGVEAAGLGIADLDIPDGDLMEGVQKWAEANIIPASASSLRHARRASRWPWTDALERVLPELEARYLGALQETQDAKEGIQAFLEKRAPEWSNE
ncbi:MAG: enoyl-CoA hydratase-related protein [Planctomycetota bacterium]|jgi:cyclohexa-1,5-dienecarbonyl-CoA hydratase|nr:enoyl-CoA hydratase-related protein [Planctomycetota bacterium]